MRKQLLTIICAFILTFNMLAVGISAEEITPTPSTGVTDSDGRYVFDVSTEDFLENLWYPYLSFVTKPWVFTKKAWLTVDEYFDWIDSLDDNTLTQYPNVTIHSKYPPTGNIALDVEQSDEITVPQPVEQTVINFVQNEVSQNPQGFKECYISSFAYLNTSQFTNFQLYSSVKEVIKEHDLSFIMAPNGWDSYQGRYAYICCVDRSKCDINFYGSTLNGVFTSVNIEHNWSQFGFPYNQEIEGIEYYMFANNKTTLGHGNTIQSCWYNFMGYNGSNWTPPTNGTIKNTTGIGTSTSSLNVFTGKEKDELVYVFDTINSLKNYNVQAPRDYYLTDKGLEGGAWTASNGGAINTGTMNNSGNYYNSVVNNITYGMTAQELQDLINKTSNQPEGNNGDGGSNNHGFGSTVQEIISGIGEFFSGLLEGIADALLGKKNALGIREGGILATLKDIFTSLIEVLTGGIIMDFLSAFMGWLPETILHLLTALFGIGVLFALVRFIRKAF